MKILNKIKLSQVILGFIIASARFLWTEDKHIVTTHYTYRSKKVPKSFDGFKIVQVSDFHNAYFGRRSKHLLEAVEVAAPDAIVITGDIVDRRTPCLKRAAVLVEGITAIQKTFYVTGNHEAHYKHFNKLYDVIGKSDVRNITKHSAELERNGEKINLAGINDVWFFGDEVNPETYRNFKQELADKVNILPHDFTVLLAHRPELLPVYSKNDVDLVFSGHAHGGQIRLPVVKGLYAPHQGVNPKYTEGMHEQNGTTMVVSRGLGNSRFPFRVFNHPEVVVVELRSEA
jgi:uncharacterized protein